MDLALFARLFLVSMWLLNLRAAYRDHGQWRPVRRMSFWDDVINLVVLNLLLAATGWWSSPPCQ